MKSLDPNDGGHQLPIDGPKGRCLVEDASCVNCSEHCLIYGGMDNLPHFLT